MKKEKPLILLSNDDGVEAKGLNELIRGLRGMGFGMQVNNLGVQSHLNLIRIGKY